MAKKIISPDIWLAIKTEYQIGMGIRELSRKYDVGVSTISEKKTKENWTQEANAKLIEAVSAVHEYEQVFVSEQLPMARDRLKEQLELHDKVRDFLSTAVNINLKNMQEVALEPDVKDRIRMMSIMRANMSDLANVYPTTVKEADKEDKQEDKVINLIME